VKYLFFSILILLSVSSCETDFDVNANWQEVTVVYGLLNPNQQDQLIKINKAFLGDGNALKIASEFADSINYNPSDLIVTLFKVNESSFNSYEIVDSIVLDTVMITKPDGVFSTENNIIYSCPSPENFFKGNSSYLLEILNLKTGHSVNSFTEIINDGGFNGINPNFSWGLYNPIFVDSLKFISKRVEWLPSDNGAIYQLDVVVNYSENGILDSLVWTQPVVEPSQINSNSDISLFLDSEIFFQYLTNNLSQNTAKEFKDLDLVMTVGARDLQTYINVNKPFSGIVQERPVFSNINNGIGLFSSRYTYRVNEITLNQNTLNYLKNNLDLGFE